MFFTSTCLSAVLSVLLYSKLRYILQCLIPLVYLLCLVAKIYPHYLRRLSWAGTTACVWAAIDLWSSVFAVFFCSHAFPLFVFYWRRWGFLPRGWLGVWVVGVEVLSVVWRGWWWWWWWRWRGIGGVHAFCAACLVILWDHLSTSKPSSADVLAHLSFLTVWISFWYICTSAVGQFLCLSLYC